MHLSLHPLQDPVLSGARPPAESAKGGRIRIPLGGTASFNLGIHPSASVPDAVIEAADIPMGWRTRDRVKVRVLLAPPARAREEAGPLLPSGPLDLKAGEPRGVTVVLEVPEDAPVAVVAGSVALKGPGGAVLARIETEIEVLPFRAAPSATLQGTFYYGPIRDSLSLPEEEAKKALERSLKDALDMRAHGLETFCVYAEHDKPEELLRRSGEDGDISLTVLERYLRIYRSAGFRGPVPLWFSRKIQTEKDAWYPGNWLKFDEASLARCLRIVRTICRERIRRGWPEVLFYAIDEPGQLARARLAGRLFRHIRQIPGARTFTCPAFADTVHAYGEELDVACMGPAVRWEDEKRQAEAYGFELWKYLPLHERTDPAWLRANAGVIPWGQRRRGILYYRYEGCGVDVEAGKSTLGWEAIREGIEDGRALHTLELLAERGRAATTEVQPLAEAERFLARARGEIESIDIPLLDHLPDAGFRREAEREGKEDLYRAQVARWGGDRLDRGRDEALALCRALSEALRGARFQDKDQWLGRRVQPGETPPKFDEWVARHGPERHLPRDETLA